MLPQELIALKRDGAELSREDFLEERLAVMQQEHSPVMVDLGVVDATGTQVAYAGPFRLGRADYSDAASGIAVMPTKSAPSRSSRSISAAVSRRGPWVTA